MATLHFYTITVDGKKYRAMCPHYQWSKVVAYFGVSRNQIERGSDSKLPWYEGKVNE